MTKETDDKSFANSSIKEKFGMAKNFAQALISRGVSNKKTDVTTKRLRVLSCLGNGNELPPWIVTGKQNF